jgi:hypothetical protein
MAVLLLSVFILYVIVIIMTNSTRAGHVATYEGEDKCQIERDH